MKRWVQYAVIGILLAVIINLGVLNMDIRNHQNQLNAIATNAQWVDMQLADQIQQHYNDRCETELLLANSIGQVKDQVDRMQSTVEDITGDLDVFINGVHNVVESRIGSVVRVSFEYEYYEHPMMGRMVVCPGTQEPFMLSGSGIVIHDSGVILTAAHVVDLKEHRSEGFGPVTRGWVTFEDGTERPIKGVRYVPNQSPDVGLIEIDPEGLNLSPIPMLPDASRSLSKGDSVVLITSPHGYTNTVEVGVIGALVCQVDDLEVNEYNFLQISAQIAGGSSGGPVFDLHGNFIGIVVMGIHTGGIVFVVPVDVIVEHGISRCTYEEAINVTSD